MFKLIGILISVFLIIIISLKIPQENVGLASFASRSNFLGSQSGAQNFLNITIVIGILIYFLVAIQLNLAYSF